MDNRFFAFCISFSSFFCPFLWSGSEAEVAAQGEANFWYFGNSAGLDFNGGPPVAVTNGQMYAGEGSASISDAAGNLLFYTNGTQVWDRSHVQMPNGFGLMGHFSTTQSSVIIQKPGNTTIYYIFTADYEAQANGIRYNEVDMTLNAGLGDLTANKNVPLYTPSCEKIAAIRHCNNQDIWVVTHDRNSNAFRTYLVTAAGVNTVPIVSNAGVVVSGGPTNAIGHLKGSPDGKKLASATEPPNRLELFDFNNSTGIVSNAILFSQPVGSNYAYGVEFSPDGTKLYCAYETAPGQIYQFDLCAGSNTAIANSGVLIGTSSGPEIGSIQLGPDQKIYVATYTKSSLGVISSPNTLGVGCTYVDNGISLAGKYAQLGLPNFVSSYLKPPPAPFTAAVNCLTGIFIVPPVNCSGSSNPITSLSWNFGDPASGANNTSSNNNPSHTFTSAGTYTVTLVLNYVCGNDTIRQNVSTVNTLSVSASSTQAGCASATGTATAHPTGGTGTLTYSWTPYGGNSATATGLAAGNYTVMVTDGSGCANTQTIAVTSVNTLSVTASSISAGCASATGTATVTPIGGTGTLSYAWSPSGGNNANATGLAAGNYTVTVTDANGCTQTQTVTVTSSNAPTVTLASQANILCYGQCTGSAAVAAAGGNGPYTYLWNPAATASASVTGLCAGNYMVTVTDDDGCIVTQTVTITQPASALSITPNVTQTGCNTSTGSAAALVAGGSAPYTYLWNPTAAATATATGLYAGSYTVTVTDANGCSSDTSVDVTEIVCPCPATLNLTLPNAFSPNNDGENDEFCLQGGLPAGQAGIQDCIKKLNVIIYNRWGEKVFESDDKNFCWDGFCQGKLQNSSVFIYYMNATLSSEKKITRKGNISMIR